MLTRKIQVTVKFMPVHIPTPEEKTDPILFAKVGVSWFVVFFLLHIFETQGSAKGDGFGAGGSSDGRAEGRVCKGAEKRKVT